ncbi:MAG TPA: protein kinase [Candidatus Dormibacteraeota bacterium]|nr:protein kinase [Candidatus Dormibacteraeota bacterium]
MTPERWQEVKKVLAGALEKAPEERSAYLNATCADAEVRREVESLLVEYESGDFSPADEPTLIPEASGAPKSGDRLGPYEVVARIGAGGMGEVYRARDHRLERDVAIKIFAPWRRIDDSARRRFRKEALALAKLNHPSIAAVYDLGEQDGRDFLVMEYVPGESLAEKVKSGPLPLAQTLALGEEIAQALQEAHEHGIVHRDLKPANVIVTPKGHAKVLDFGLAKLLADPGAGDVTLSVPETIGPVGTPLYMSPEQTEGKAVDSRTDLWSLGVVLYELLAGKPPFERRGGTALLRAIAEEKERPLREVRPDIPAETEKIVSRALEKDASKRYQSASEMARDLSSELSRVSGPAATGARREVRMSRGYAVAAALALVASIATGAWLYHRIEQRQWAREQAIPQIAKLQDERKALAAFLLLKKAERILPGDPRLAQLAAQNTQIVSINSSPSGATVQIKDYLSPASAWYPLGITPLKNIRIPSGYFRWQVSRAGVGTYEAAPFVHQQQNFALDKEVSAPAAMSWASGGPWISYIGFVGTVGPYQLSPYYIDRYEVSNRDYQKFVDAGGYANPKYWTNTFVRDGREMKWEDAMAIFRDSTGRPGPSTWEGGHYPAGQSDDPVSGVSWYEASAYAAFAGKSLPAFAQWYASAAPDLADYIVQDSNISLSKLAPVGSYQGLGPDGTYDMAGNVREWVLNDTGEGTKFILGGSWRAQTYLYGEPEALSPFDRSPENGFRCVRNTAPLSAALVKPVKKLERDFSKFKPVQDDVFRAYLTLYAYDKTPLNAKAEGIVGETDDWREEKVTYDTAYNGERMAAYLFLPKHVKPPYQTIVFSPSARVLNLHDSQNLGDVTFFDYIVQSGRAVLYPVYYGTYERQGPTVYLGAAQKLSYLANRSKDLGRSLDYLATRTDIDKSRIAYLGVSMGSAEGVIYSTIAQSRLKTVIFLDGGYFLDQPPPGGDQADFAPRLKVPVLMVNGREDYVFSVEECQDPLFRMLGTPDADKRHIILDTPHDVREQRTELVKVVLGWLDNYLGRVD